MVKRCFCEMHRGFLIIKNRNENKCILATAQL